MRSIIVDLIIIKLFGVCPLFFPMCVLECDCYFGMVNFVVTFLAPNNVHQHLDLSG